MLRQLRLLPRRAAHAWRRAADLRSLFNWNVKQVFVYVYAEFRTDSHVRPPGRAPASLPPAAHPRRRRS